MRIHSVFCSLLLSVATLLTVQAQQSVDTSNLSSLVEKNETNTADSVKALRCAQVKNHLRTHYKPYGFIRNYFTYDSRESLAGVGDLFNYLPKDNLWNQTEAEALASGVEREDLNARQSMRYLSLTTRVGLDIMDYRWGNTVFGGKIEADFYAGLTGVTGVAQFRLRHAYMTMSWDSLKMADGRFARLDLLLGQAWHPLAGDLCDVLSLNTGAPFAPFSRTPQVRFDARLLPWFSLSAVAMWQMQYTSVGPDGPSANYIKYSMTPEAYLGLNFMQDETLLFRMGVDVLSIKPRSVGEQRGMGDTMVKVKVKDRLTTVTPFAYLQLKAGSFSLKIKTVLAEAGEHVNLNGGYGVSAVNADGSWEYTPTRNSSTWVSMSYGKKVKGILFAGYVQNFGTKAPLVDADHFYFSKNSYSNLNRLWRLTPAVLWTIGPFQLGAEYELTSAQYGSGLMNLSKGLFDSNLHWVYNHRVQVVTKFNF